MRNSIVVAIALCMFMTVLSFVSCGGGGKHSGGFASLIRAHNKATDVGVNSDSPDFDISRTLSIEQAIADARAYEPPAEVTYDPKFDPLVFERLRNEFIRQLEADGDRMISSAPLGDAGRVTDLSYDSDTGMLNWTYVNTGDYDSSGEVGIPDITMIAQNYLANTSDGIGDDALESWIDGDKSGEVGISDITPIAQGYLNDVESYRILTSKHSSGGFVPIGSDIPISPAVEYPLAFSAQLPDEALVFVVVAPVDGDGVMGEISNPVIFAYSIFKDVPPDTIFLYAPSERVQTGEWTYIFVCANVDESKPLAGFTARILVQQNQLNATEIGCMALSESNSDFQNLFATAMAADAVSGGDILYPSFVGCDFWKGYADQTDVTLIAAPSLPQPAFVDVGIYWDYRSNFIERTGVGILAIVKFRGMEAGATSLLIQGRDSEDNIKTVYDDLAANNYEFANIGELITINVS